MVTWTPEQFLMHVQAALDAIRQKVIDGELLKLKKKRRSASIDSRRPKELLMTSRGWMRTLPRRGP